MRSRLRALHPGGRRRHVAGRAAHQSRAACSGFVVCERCRGSLRYRSGRGGTATVSVPPIPDLDADGGLSLEGGAAPASTPPVPASTPGPKGFRLESPSGCRVRLLPRTAPGEGRSAPVRRSTRARVPTRYTPPSVPAPLRPVRRRTGGVAAVSGGYGEGAASRRGSRRVPAPARDCNGTGTGGERGCGPEPGRRSRPASALPAGCYPHEGGERVPAARAPGRLSRHIPAEAGEWRHGGRTLPPDRGAKMARAGASVKRAVGESVPFR